MRKTTIYFLLSIAFLLSDMSYGVQAQCVILDNAVPGITLQSSADGTANRSGVVFNADANLYYSVNAGASNYPIDTFDESGERVNSVSGGFDYRGAWWNPNTSQFEGNGFGDLGIFVQTLSAGTSFPSGSGATIFTANQPNSQSVGDFDYNDNEILYFANEFIHRYSRADNSFIGQFRVNNLPVAFSSINSNSVFYTGCPGQEIGLYDFTNKRFLFIDKATGNFVGFSQLPAEAPARSSFGTSYANMHFWVFNSTSRIWTSYQVLNYDNLLSDENENLARLVTLYPNPTTNSINIDLQTVQGPAKMHVLNAQGQQLLQQDLKSGQRNQVVTEHLPPGIYFAQIQHGQARTTKKFIKQ